MKFSKKTSTKNLLHSNYFSADEESFETTFNAKKEPKSVKKMRDRYDQRDNKHRRGII